MKKVNIIGVPEHFNLPWHMAMEENLFENRGIELIWTDIPEGTGRMCQMLAANEADIAIILTEGIVKSISDGAPVKIVQEFISTPLQWGIHVAANSTIKNTKELEGKIAAISRYGSGSHLISYVNAQYNDWDHSELKFQIINNLDGAVDALTNGKADYFLWEHFTTKPIVDKGIFRRLGDCPTPWPCFVIAVTASFLAKEHSTLNHILEIINNYTKEFKQIPSIDRTLANRYEQQLDDIQEWLSITAWSQQQIDRNTIDLVSKTLKELGRIEEIVPIDKIIH